MTIGEYREQLQQEIHRATKEGRDLEGQALLTLLHLIRDLDGNAPARLLTFSEIARVGQAATDLADQECEAGRITKEECWLVYLKFYARAEAAKHRGEPLNLGLIRAQTQVYII